LNLPVRGRSSCRFSVFLLSISWFAYIGCGGLPEVSESVTGTATVSPAGVPVADTTDMETQVIEHFRSAREAVESDLKSAEAWGRLGAVYHSHELWPEAELSYRYAEALDPSDPRWPYFLADVLSVVGTSLDASVDAFRRAIALKPGYAPAHMRLGRVLITQGQPEAAAVEFERALGLEEGLQPARVALAQVRLSENALDRSAELLERTLETEPRHAQALSTLGQVYMRLGRRDEARQIAERARDAALYNLFDDPLMSEVVNEGVSSVLVWERAKAFLDHGNYEQAVLGLRRVVELKPRAADAHQQLGTAYGNLGETERARYHLAKTVELDPDRVDAMIQLATAELELGEAGEAVRNLTEILELAPDDPDAPWLLGRARLLGGDVPAGLAAFESAEAAGREAPVWARNDWGSALAQSGRPREALAQFQAALEIDPRDAQALFYTGLTLEGFGQLQPAIEHYCRSMASQQNQPAAARLQALGQRCP